MIALSVAAALAVFLLYTSIAGGGTPSLRPSTLAGHTGKVSVAGRVLKPVTGDAHGAGLRFRLRDVEGHRDGAGRLQGLRPGPVPRRPRHRRPGALRNGVFVAIPGTLVTKCPSKYTPKQS